jgi:acyl-CoA thioesterase II
MQIDPYPYRASAWWNGRIVAQSDRCLCAEVPGALPVLYFPLADVNDALDLEGSSEGLSGCVLTAQPLPELAGHVAFDHDRVRIEVIDEVEGDDARDVTVKRFPTWGDAAHLVDVMDVRPADDGLTFFGAARGDDRRPVVEGSQMLGQAIVAAGRRAPDRRVMSATMIMVRVADAHQPLHFELVELSSGRTFAAVSVQVLQGGRVCAAGTVLLDAPSADVVRHAAAAPDVPGPYECPSYDMGVTGRDIRVVDGAYSSEQSAPAGPPTVDAWVRFRHVPDDPALHAGLLAQFTGHMSIAAALRPHEGVSQDQAHRTLSMAINSISLSLYGPVKVDDWLLYHHHSTFAGTGTTHAENRVYDLDGALVASFSVDAMVRPLPSGAKGPMDARTAL